MLPVKGGFMLLSLSLLCPLVAQADEDNTPSLEMLEFLADWSVEDQAWLDEKVMQEQDGEQVSTEVNEDE